MYSLIPSFQSFGVRTKRECRPVRNGWQKGKTVSSPLSLPGPCSRGNSASPEPALISRAWVMRFASESRPIQTSGDDHEHVREGRARYDRDNFSADSLHDGP